MKTDKGTQQRSTVVGLFHSRDDAIRAMTDLKSAGFAAGEISLVGKNSDGEVVRDEHGKRSVPRPGRPLGRRGAGLSGHVLRRHSRYRPILAVGPLAAA